MGRKGDKYKRKESSGPTKKNAIPFNSDDEGMMNDEIDAFHKQRDVVPMWLDEDMDESDKAGEQSVLNIEDDDDEEDAENDDPHLRVLRQILICIVQRTGGVEDEVFDDTHEEEHEKVVWGGTGYKYGADVVNEPLSSNYENAAEEAEVLKLQSEKAKALSMEDYGLGDTGQDVADAEPTLEEIFYQGKPASRPSFDKVTKDESHETGLMHEVVKKDVNSLTKEEQMDVVYRNVDCSGINGSWPLWSAARIGT